MPRLVHPEAREGEVWLGNVWACDFPRIGWDSKRMGKTPRGSDGKVLKGGNMRPVFVSLAELEAAGVPIPDTGPIDHRW